MHITALAGEGTPANGDRLADSAGIGMQLQSLQYIVYTQGKTIE